MVADLGIDVTPLVGTEAPCSSRAKLSIFSKLSHGSSGKERTVRYSLIEDLDGGLKIDYGSNTTFILRCSMDILKKIRPDIFKKRLGWG